MYITSNYVYTTIEMLNKLNHFFTETWWAGFENLRVPYYRVMHIIEGAEHRFLSTE